jgi:MFS family permease
LSPAAETDHDAPGDDPVPTDTAKRLLPWLVAVGFFMESLDTTILNTAVPTIAHALKVAPLSMKAVLASYTLSVAVFIPISGWMANRDRFSAESAPIFTCWLHAAFCRAAVAR